MTDTKPNKLTNETSTVDINLEGQRAVINSSKHKADFVVGKLRSQMFFQVSTTAGALPKELSGKYRSLETAIKSVQDFIKNSKETFAVRSDRLHEERQQRKHADAKPENSK